jgi:protein-disulfide isomerase
MFTSGQPHAVLLRIAQSAGLTDAQFEACIKDEAALNALNARWERYMRDDHINATPTFVINGKLYDKGELTMPEMDAAVAEASAGAKAAS